MVGFGILYIKQMHIDWWEIIDLLCMEDSSFNIMTLIFSL